MSNPNLGWLFYKDYYSAIEDWCEPTESKQAIAKKVDLLIAKAPKIEQSNPLGNLHFTATTTYPGLLVGSGYSHELPSVEGQAILGFDFDYTSGLPILRGSSIKGVLRSAFRHWEYIAEIVSSDSLSSREAIEELESEIFDNGDIFFDAVVTRYGTGLLGDDYITPHGDDPLKDPKPLRFIKVMPNVTFGFDFELRDGLLSGREKILLFAEILADLGIGAKTNVGYGKFDTLTKDSITKQLDTQEEEMIAIRKAENESKRLSSLSPLQRKIEEIPSENGSKIAPLLRAIKNGDFDEDKKKALEELKKIMVEEKVWVEQSKAKKPDKDKKHKRTIEVMEMMRV